MTTKRDQTEGCLYFDWAATAPVEADIARQAAEIAIEYFGNPSSTHLAGAAARSLLAEVRSSCARALEVEPQQLFFTGGGTEANHLPLLSLLQRPSAGTIVVSAIEHPSIREQANMLTRCGWQVVQARPDSSGIISPEAIRSALTSDTIMVCLMAVNNETGAMQPVCQVADLLTEHAKSSGKRRPRLHVDCVQAAGKLPLCLSHPGIDSAALSAHKIGGPRGLGLLYLSQRFEGFIRGGGQEQGVRSGTENLAGAWALAKCLERHYLPAGPEGTPHRQEGAAYTRFLLQRDLTRDFLIQLKAIRGCSLIPECRLDSEYEDRFSPWIVQAAFTGLPGEVLVRAMSERKIAISTGSACSSRKLSRPVLEAMGVPRELATNGVRFSFGPTTTREDMTRLLAAITEIRQLF